MSPSSQQAAIRALYTRAPNAPTDALAHAPLPARNARAATHAQNTAPEQPRNQVTVTHGVAKPAPYTRVQVQAVADLTPPPSPLHAQTISKKLPPPSNLTAERTPALAETESAPIVAPAPLKSMTFAEDPYPTGPNGELLVYRSPGIVLRNNDTQSPLAIAKTTANTDETLAALAPSAGTPANDTPLIALPDKPLPPEPDEQWRNRRPQRRPPFIPNNPPAPGPDAKPPADLAAIKPLLDQNATAPAPTPNPPAPTVASTQPVPAPAPATPDAKPPNQQAASPPKPDAQPAAIAANPAPPPDTKTPPAAPAMAENKPPSAATPEAAAKPQPPTPAIAEAKPTPSANVPVAQANVPATPPETITAEETETAKAEATQRMKSETEKAEAAAKILQSAKAKETAKKETKTAQPAKTATAANKPAADETWPKLSTTMASAAPPPLMLPGNRIMPQQGNAHALPTPTPLLAQTAPTSTTSILSAHVPTDAIQHWQGGAIALHPNLPTQTNLAATPLAPVDKSFVPAVLGRPASLPPAPQIEATPASQLAAAPEATDKTEPLREISKESQTILNKLPASIGPKKSKAASKELAVLRGKAGQEQAEQGTVQPNSISHDGLGIKIEIKAPQINLDYELGKAYDALTAGNNDEAISIYRKVLESDEKNKNALFGLATIYHRAGQIEKARPLYARLLTVDPNNRDGLNNFLVLLADEAPEDALTHLEALRQANPDFSPIPAQMAVIYQKLGQSDKAIENMTKAIQLAPENLAYRYNFAIMLDKQKKYEEAATLYRQILEAYQRGDKVPGNIQQIQQRLTFISSNRN